MRIRLPIIALAIALVLPMFAMAQLPNAPEPVFQNIYAAGVSANPGTKPTVAATVLYARQIMATDEISGVVKPTGTFLFTVMDILPATKNPFTVTTNIGGGIAQKIVTLGKVPIYVPTAAGVSFNGSDVSWAWNTGAIASFRFKDKYFIMPTVRVSKSYINGDTQYHPIVGVLFGLGS